jgi:glycosyltransferase involved in cell wall biosynthesis
VDLYQFQVRSKGEARRKLQLPFDTRVALYVGRLYQWKRLDILARAAYLLDAITLYVVGGSKEEFSQAAGVADLPPNLVCVGGKGFGEIPLWLAAADILLVGGTKQNNYSYLHTSAMKIFEYMAAGSEHAIVAADTPANRQILSDNEATFYEPDNARDLADKIEYAFNFWSEAAHLKGGNALTKVRQFTWEKRAESILKTFSSRLESG